MTARQFAAALPSPIVEAANRAPVDHGRALFDLLRQKWKEVPAGLTERVDTGKVLALSDWELRDYWEGVWHVATTGPAYAVRGWYQEQYADMFRGKRVLEIGSGCGIDGVNFIRQGAKWYFADIVPNNLKLIRRILDAFGLDCEGVTVIEDLQSFDRIPSGFDFIYCQGSMINVPFDFARRETLQILTRLKPGGRWIERCYPQERWAREGRLPFAEWGKVTDGEATPWVEWYDLERLRARFAPVVVSPLTAFNYYNDELNWFDLKIDAVPDGAQIARLLTEAAPRRLPIGLTPQGFKRHGATTVEPVQSATGPALRVRTPAPIWAFALQGTIGAQTLRSALADPADTQVVPAIEITLSVQQGRVGVGLVSDDMSTYMLQERYLSPRDEPQVLTLPCPAGHARYHLILRNTQGGDTPSIFTLHQIVLTSHRADDPGSAPNLIGGTAPVIALSALVRRHQQATIAENGGSEASLAPSEMPIFVRAVDIDRLDRTLGFAEPSAPISTDRNKEYRGWSMENDDAPILAYLYRNHRPKRHLEFGTWEGFGATLCAANSDAEIWTLNLPDGERDAAGGPVYASARADNDRPVEANPYTIDAGKGAYYQTDSGPFIGWRYRQAGLKGRVHQILVDTTKWDTSAFAPGFFDSVLIDGGHHANVVVSDTEKALPLLRSGGLMLWHDFCPADGPMTDFPATRGVVWGIHQGWRRWSQHFSQMFWVRPSFLLVGVKR